MNWGKASRIEGGTVVTEFRSGGSGIRYHFIKKNISKNILGMLRDARGEVMLYGGALVFKGADSPTK